MSGNRTVFRFVLALSLAVAGLALLVGLLGGGQEHVYAAAPMDVRNAPLWSPNPELPFDLVHSPLGTRLAAPLRNGGVDAGTVVTVCKLSAVCPYTSVQKAVNDATAGFVIKVAQGLYDDAYGFAGHEQVLYITQSLTVRGGYTVTNWSVSDPDKNPTILDSGNQSGRRGVYIDAGVAPTVEGFHIRNGDATQGAGVYIAGGEPMVRRNRIYDNVAQFGGGVHIAGGSPKLENCLVYSNTANSGAGVYAGGSDSPVIWFNTIYGNDAATQGGGIYAASGTPVIYASIVASNTAPTNGGGGIFKEASVPNDVKYNDVVGNSGGDFVGFDNTAGNIQVSPRFVDRSAQDFRLQGDSECIGRDDPANYPSTGPVDDFDSYGRPFGPYPDIGAHEYHAPSACYARLGNGQVYTEVQGAADDGPAGDLIRVTGVCTGSGSGPVVFLNRVAILRGGYLKNDWGTPDPIRNRTILDGEGVRRVVEIGSNVAATVEGFDIRNGYSDIDGGGGVRVGSSEAVIRNNRIYSNSVSNKEGAGIYLAGGSPTVENNHIYLNVSSSIAQGGGGIFVLRDNPVVRNNHIYSNTDSSKNGGGVYVWSGDAVVEGNWIYHNSADKGGGIFIESGGPVIRNNEIYTNTARTHGGGAAVGGGYATIRANKVYSNTAPERGGGCYILAGTPTLEENQIYGNRAKATGGTNGGGGIYVLVPASPTVRRNIIYGNSTPGPGGGIHIYSGSNSLVVTVERNAIYDNSASAGGGVRVWIHDRYSSVGIRNNLIYGNTASGNGGGISLEDRPVARVESNTIYGNQAANNGGGIYDDPSPGAPAWWNVISSTIIASNTAASGGGFYRTGGISTLLAYNDVWGNIGGNYGNMGSVVTPTDISEDPLFVDPAGADFWLQAGSPCIGAADPDHYPPYDFDGYARPLGVRADIGAHEAHPGTCFARVGGSQVYTAVQAAVDAAGIGDEVRVAGLCEGSQGKVTVNQSLILRGGFTKTNWFTITTPTILDASGPGRVITITGASNMAVTVGELIVRGGAGAGIYVATPLSPTIRNVIAYSNGDGFLLATGGSPRLVNNTFASNADNGIELNDTGSPVISNTIVVSNGNNGIIGGSPVLAYNDVWDNGSADYGGGLSPGPTDISKNPRFVDPGAGNLRLRFDSPCVHAADPNTGLAWDFEGDVRPDGTGQGHRHDIGADEATDYLGVDFGPDYVAVTPDGRVISYTQYLTNSGTWDDSFVITHTLSVSGDDPSRWSIGYPRHLELPSGEATAVLITVSIPSGVVSGTQATGLLTATSQTGAPDFHDVASCTIDIISNWGFELSPVYSQEASDPGLVVTHVHTLTNRGGSDSFTLSVSSGLGWAQVIPADKVEDLGTGKSASVQVVVSVPITASGDTVEETVLVVSSVGAATSGEVFQRTVTDTTYVNYIYGDRHVATTGSDDGGNNSCRVSAFPCRTIKQAVGQASGGEYIRVAEGVYEEYNVTLNEAVILQGGYPADDWTPFDPDTYTTTIDALGLGRVLYIGGNPIVEGLTLRNGDVNGFGGGVYIAQGADPTLRRNIITGNTARSSGGVTGRGAGVYNAGGDPTLERNTVVGNTADEYGGGLYNRGGTAHVWSNFFHGNEAANGGGFYNNDGSPLVWHNTFVRNTADYGGGLYLAGGSPVVSNTIVFSNTAGSAGGGVYYAAGSLDYNDVGGNTPDQYSGVDPGAHSISMNPLFVNAAMDDYHLLKASPCRDIGDSVDMDVVVEDFDGQPREMNGTPDMGADEYQKADVALLSLDPVQIGDEGEWLTYTHILTNTGNYDDDYLLTWHSDLSDGWTVVVNEAITPPVLITGLAQYATTTVEVLIHIPADIISGTINETTITATSQVDPEVSDSVANTTIVGRNIGVSLEPDIVGWADQTKSVTYDHVLINEGNYTDTFDLEVTCYPVPEGSSFWDATLVSPASPVALAKGDSVTVSVVVNVPLDAATVEVNTTVITARSQTDFGAFAVVTDTTVAERRLGMDFAPDGALSGETGKDISKPGQPSVVYTHILTNSGNYTDTYMLTHTSERGWPVLIEGQVPPVLLTVGAWPPPAPPGVRAVEVKVFIPDPPVAYGGWQDTMVITATSVDSPTMSRSVTDVTTAIQEEGVELKPSYNLNYEDSGGNKLLTRMVVTPTSQLVTFTHTLRNNSFSNSTDTFTLTWSVSLPWAVVVSPTQTGEMAWHDEITDVQVSLTVPPTVTHPFPAPVAAILVTATSWFSPTGLHGQATVVDKAVINQWVQAKWSPGGVQVGPPDYDPPGGDPDSEGTIVYTHVLTNVGNYTDSFSLDFWSSWGRRTVKFPGITNNRTPDIGPGQGRVITMEVTVPFTRCDATGTVIVTATSRTPGPAGTTNYSPTVGVSDTISINPIYYVATSPALERRYVSTSTTPLIKTYTHWLTNTGNCDNFFSLGAHGSFNPAVLPMNTGLLSSWLDAGDSSTLVSVTVTVPQADPGILLTGTVVITADGVSGGLSDFVAVTDTIIINQQVRAALGPDRTETITQAGRVPILYTHTLTNDGNYADAFTLTWWNEDGWEVWLRLNGGKWEKQTDQWNKPKSVETSSLGAGDTAQVDVQVFVESDVYTVTNRTWITATSLTPENEEEVAVYAPMAVATDTTKVRRPHVTLEPDYVEAVAAGDTYTYVHTLLNSGGLTDSYTITYASSHPLGWVDSLTPPTVNDLQPGHTSPVTLVVSVPGGSDPSERDITVITATSWMSYAYTVYDVATDTTNVLYVLDAELSLADPVSADPGASVTFTHRLTNTGNYPGRFELRTDQEFSDVSIEPEEVQGLEPYQSIPVTVTVTVPVYAASGEAERVKINVRGFDETTGQWKQVETVEDTVNISPTSGDRFVALTGSDDHNNCTMRGDREPCRTVQHAVDQAVHGDTVKVAAGQYFDVLDADQVVRVSESITLIGGYTIGDWITSQPETRQTILDAEGQRRVMYIDTAITPTIQGFHLRGGLVDSYGAGLFIAAGAEPSVRVNRVYSNTASDVDSQGGGIYYGGGGNPMFERNAIYDNVAANGAGVYLWSGGTQLWSNLIYRNVADDYGGGLYVLSGAPLIRNNTFYSNTASTFGGGGLYANSGTPVVSSTIVAGNAGYGIREGGTAEFNLAYNDVWANTPGQYYPPSTPHVDDISENPRFADALNDELRLTFRSPCINTGDPDISTPPDEDYEGNDRLLLGRRDIGAYEYGITSTKTVTRFAEPDTVITYTVRVTNTGAVAHTIRVTDTLHKFLDPTGVMAYTVGRGDYLSPTGVISWTGPVSGNSTVYVTFTAHVVDGVAYFTPITNVAWVDYGRTGVVTTTVVPVHGTRLVAPTGSDVDNDCRLSPCETIQHAVSQAQNGDEVKVAAGVYADGVITVGKPIVLTGGYSFTDWETFDPNANETTLQAPVDEPGVIISGSQVTLAGFHIVGATDGVSVTPGSDLTLYRSWVHDNDDGVQVEGGAYTLIDNVFAQNTQVGLRTAGSDGVVIHNTFASNLGGAVINGTALVTNTIFSTHTVAVSVLAGSVELWNTLWWGGGTYTTGTSIEHSSIVGNPLFVDSAQMDYHILEESAAVDNGAPVDSSVVSEDFDGEARWVRERPDIGADEFPLGLNKYGPEAAEPGDMITYTIELDAVDVDLVITDVLPIYVTFASPTNTVTCSAPSCGVDEANQTITWMGESTGKVFITYTGHLEPWLGKGEIITNSAMLERQGIVDESALWQTVISQAHGTRYVAPTGDDEVTDGTDNNCLVAQKPCRTIQWAVDQAMDGDTVKVAAGTYTGTASQVVRVDKAITLIGGCAMPGWDCDPDAYSTYLDGQNARRAMYIRNTPGPVTVGGFHLLNGYTTNHGGGLRVDGATTTLAHSWVYSNTAVGTTGGGIYLSAADATLVGNQVYNNTAGTFGGGVFVLGAGTDYHMTNNVFADNQAGSGGDGLAFDGSAGPRAFMRHNTIANNDGQGLFVNRFTLAMTNTIMAGHTVGVETLSSANVTADHTLWDGVGSLDAGSGTRVIANTLIGSPSFVDPAAQDYHIRGGSDAFDQGVDVGVADDIDGEPRPMGHWPDIGADELRVGVGVVKEARPPTVEPGDQLTYTIYVTNTGLVTLTATITDFLPAEVTTSDPTSWSSVAIDPEGTWEADIVATVGFGVSGLITNVVRVTTLEGAMGAFTMTALVTDTPDITVDPLSLHTTLNPGNTDTGVLAIGNVGRANLNWSLAEIPTVGWLDESSMGGVVAPSNSTNVVVTFTAPLIEDLYSTVLRITSDDPDRPQVDVAVMLTVTTECIGVTGATFDFTPTGPLAGQAITFTAAYLPSNASIPVSYTWDFGDGSGQTSPTTNPIITYSYADPSPIGGYTVAMTATNACGVGVTSRQVLVSSADRYIYLPLVLRNY